MDTTTTDRLEMSTGELRDQLARMEVLEERLRLALRAGHIGTYDMDPQTHAATCDAELLDIFGLPRGTTDIFGAVSAAVVSEDRSAFAADVERSFDPNGSRRHDIEMRITRQDTGEVRWLHTQGNVSFVDGEPVRLVGAVRDITDEKRLLEREQLLAREMNHRVQNIFAVVSGMVGMSARMSSSVDGFKEAILGRLRAMATAHSLIQPRLAGESLDQVDVNLQTLAASVLGPYMLGADRVTLDGPCVMVGPREASGLALILHEWGTNAAKHGALSRPDGRLSVKWHWLEAWDTDPRKNSDADAGSGIGVGSGASLRITWTESGGPPVTGTPGRQGFGSRLVRGTARPPAFSAVRTRWGKGGVVHELDVHGLAIST